MARPRVFIAQWMPAAGLDRIGEHADLVYDGNLDPLPRDAFLARARGADALVAFVSDYVDAGIVGDCQGLRVVSSFGKGSDNIDVAACTARGVLVTINPEALTDSTADLAIGLALAACRNIAAGDRHVRAGRFRGWHPTDLLGREFHHARLGLIGFGAIGRAIARRALAFAAEVAYHDPIRHAEEDARMGVRYLDREELLAWADFLVLAADLRPGNRHLIDAEALGRMKPGAYLINIGRGSLVDEAAVAAAIEAGTLRGYAADVFAFEDQSLPGRPPGIDPALLARADATVFTPHLGTGTMQARDRLAISTAHQLLAALRGEVPSGAVNPEAIARRADGPAQMADGGQMADDRCDGA